MQALFSAFTAEHAEIAEILYFLSALGELCGAKIGINKMGLEIIESMF